MKEKLKVRKNKFLRNKKSFIFLLILCLGIGFAYLSTQLSIIGNTSVSGNKWSVYFNNVQITDGSVDASVVPTTTGTTTTSLNYTVLLDKPGDFYEFTVDAVNAGTIDAMIESITMTSLDSDVIKYLSYTANYLDGEIVEESDILDAKDTTTYKVRIEYKKDISASDLDEDGINISLSFGINYVQSTVKKYPSQFAKLIKNNATSDSDINFAQISSDTNGKGLYVRNGTENDTYPIYYYRGDVTNNNAKFAGYCWKIVRTTETGGTKLIYNGTPDENGDCTNTTGWQTQLGGNTMFDEEYKSPAYSGYMYGSVYEVSNISLNDGYLYGNAFTYKNGMYTLSGTNTSLDETHHYTCLNATGICTELAYIYHSDEWNGTHIITLTNGKSVEDALNEMKKNENDSNIKTYLDEWFDGTFKTYFTNLSKDYNDYLEDTIWCNDRSINTLGSDYYKKNGWIPNEGNLNNFLYYGATGRTNLGRPTLTCSNKDNSFTVSSKKGNRKLDYPVGLLTADEVIFAGGANDWNDTFYLYTNQNWWTMSPAYYDINYSYEYFVGEDGFLGTSGTVNYNGVRPSISIKPEVKISTRGDGTATSPYEFVVE